MGFFSSSSSNPSSSTGSENAKIQNREDRARCWEARDAYFGCLDTQGVVKAGTEEGKCAGEEKKYGESCAKSWVSVLFSLGPLRVCQNELGASPGGSLWDRVGRRGVSDPRRPSLSRRIPRYSPIRTMTRTSKLALSSCLSTLSPSLAC